MYGKISSASIFSKAISFLESVPIRIALYFFRLFNVISKSVSPSITSLLVSIYPAIPFLIGITLLYFYEINKKMETQIEMDLRNRRLNK